MATPVEAPAEALDRATRKIENKGGKAARATDAAWLTLGNKYAPFGYLPVEVRGMPAYFVDGDARERTTVPEQGRADGLRSAST